MGTVKQFEDLEVWKLARKNVNGLNEIIRDTDLKYDYGLKNQVRRASISVMNNIAEGFESDTNKNFISYLSIAKGSAAETRSLLFNILDSGYISEEEFKLHYQRSIIISRKLHNFRSYLKNHPFKKRSL